MTDYSGLVERLRMVGNVSSKEMVRVSLEAAAAIEAQKRELDEARAERNKYDDAHKREARNVLRLTAERDEARAELARNEKTRESMRAILNRTVDAIHGEKQPDLMRSWSDIPERIAALRTEIAELRSLVEKHNARFTTTASDRIPLPPSAAPAAQPGTPYGEMGQFVTPHGGGQVAAPAASEPTMQALTSESEALGLYAEAGAGPKHECRPYDLPHGDHDWHNGQCGRCGGVQQSASLPVVPWNGGYAIRPTAEAADAFWKYWRENGETHKHGYYESTWGAINAALRAAPSPAKTEGGHE